MGGNRGGWRCVGHWGDEELLRVWIDAGEGSECGRLRRGAQREGGSDKSKMTGCRVVICQRRAPCSNKPNEKAR